jgi:hypothetical protein
MTDHTTESDYTGDDVLLDELLARAEEGMLETLSSCVDPDAGLADIFLHHPQQLPARRPRRRSSRRTPSKESQETRRP